MRIQSVNATLTPDRLIQAVAEWAKQDNRISAAALCGSHARGMANPDSDIDICLVCAQPRQLLDDTTWTAQFGTGVVGRVEDYGLVQSVRVRYEHGLEVEFGIAGREWMELPLDLPTARVFEDGLRILFDPEGKLERAANSV